MVPPDHALRNAAARRAAIEDAAADWLARRDGGFSAAEEQAFERWLAADDAHRRAVRELAAAWTLVNRPRATGRAAEAAHDLALRARNRRAVRRRIWAGVSAAGLAAAVLVVGYVPRAAISAGPEPAVASPARPHRQVLADGSVVELNTGAKIVLEFSPARRGVRLLGGEAHFSVAKDPTRPFEVMAGNVAVRAVGTQFIVRHAAQEIDVLVTEGRVAVARLAAPGAAATPAVSAPGSEPVLVDAGAAVTIPALSPGMVTPAVRPVTAAQMTAALAWRGKRVEFTGTPLAEAIGLFNRENALQLSLAEPSLATLRVSGIFWSDDPEGFARLLEGSMSLRMQRRGANDIVLTAAR